MTGFFPRLSDFSLPYGVVRPFWRGLFCHSHQFLFRHPDIAQSKQRKNKSGVLDQSAVSNLGVLKWTLYCAKRRLQSRANRRLHTLETIHNLAQTLFPNRVPLARFRHNVPLPPPTLKFVPLLNIDIARTAKQVLLLSMRRRAVLRKVVLIGQTAMDERQSRKLAFSTVFEIEKDPLGHGT